MADRALLEAEREFLLRSLDDLDDERAAGNVDDETYRTLHDDYTARAAAVIAALDTGGEPVLPAPTRAPTWMRVTTVVGIVVFAVAAAVLLGRSVGTRAPGQTLTGNAQTLDDPMSLDALRAATEADPDDHAARIAYARALLGEDSVGALREFDAASRLDPTDPEPLTYSGWIIGLAAQGTDDGEQRAQLLERAFERLDRAVAADPGYADAYVFRGLLRFNVAADPAGAVPELQQFLALAPADHPMRELVLGALERAVAQSAPGRPPTSNP